MVLSGICTCQPRLQTSHRPDGKSADVLASTLVCTTVTDASVNYSLYVPQRPQNFPLPRWDFHMFRACACDSHLSIRIDVWFYQGNVRASHACKLPIVPMGDSRFARCLQGGGVFVRAGTVAISSCTISGNTVSSVRAHVQNFPSPPWEDG